MSNLEILSQPQIKRFQRLGQQRLLFIFVWILLACIGYWNFFLVLWPTVTKTDVFTTITTKSATNTSTTSTSSSYSYSYRLTRLTTSQETSCATLEMTDHSNDNRHQGQQPLARPLIAGTVSTKSDCDFRNVTSAASNATTTTTSRFMPIVWVPIKRSSLQANFQETITIPNNDSEKEYVFIPRPITTILETIMTQPSPNNISGTHQIFPINIPTWFVNYIQWHQQQRELFPDTELLTNPNAPNVWIYNHCHGKSAGLNDRFKHFHKVVFTSYQEQRILLLQWPSSSSTLPIGNNYDSEWSLEYFLRPNLINWTVPMISYGSSYSEIMALSKDNPSRGSNHSYEFINASESSKNTGNDGIQWDRQLKTLAHDMRAFCDSQNGPVRRKGKTTRFRYWHDQRILISMNDAYPHGPSSGGIAFWMVWHSFFVPSHRLQSRLNTVMKELSLQPGYYDVVHCRVRHPGHYQKRESIPDDLGGLNYTGYKKKRALQAAVRAIQCATWITKTINTTTVSLGTNEQNEKNNKEDEQDWNSVSEKIKNSSTRYSVPTNAIMSNAAVATKQPSLHTRSNGTKTLPLYFFSDAEQLVHSVLGATRNGGGISGISQFGSIEGNGWNDRENATGRNGPYPVMEEMVMKLKSAVNQHSNVVGISWKQPLRHVNDGGHGSMESYLSSFVDFYIAAGARCIVWGVGQFAVLAGRLSGTNCTVVYPQLDRSVIHQWGMSDAWSNAEKCPIDLG